MSAAVEFIEQTDPTAEMPESVGSSPDSFGQLVSQSSAASQSHAAPSSPAMLANPASKAFAISLDFFAGPMDLLLHLVHQQEVKIEEVSMKLIAEQYLQIISGARILDLDKASEYLVIAATLMSIKSASLLPAESVTEGESSPEEMGENFYEELRARLKAYELTKARARALSAMPQLGVDVFVRSDRKALLPTAEMLAEPEDVSSLGVLFGRLMKRIGSAASSYRIRLESISVVSYMMKVVDTLGGLKEAGSTLQFRSLLRGFADVKRRSLTEQQAKQSSLEGSLSSGRGSVSSGRGSMDGSRGLVIGSFIAVLELVKRGLVQVSQTEEEGDIRLQLALAEYGTGDRTTGDFSSEFDEPPASNPQAGTPEEPTSAEQGGASTIGKVVPIAAYQRKERAPETEIEVPTPRKEVNTRGE